MFENLREYKYHKFMAKMREMPLKMFELNIGQQNENQKS